MTVLLRDINSAILTEYRLHMYSSRYTSSIALLDEYINTTHSYLQKHFSSISGHNNTASIHGTAMAGVLSIASLSKQKLTVFNTLDKYHQRTRKSVISALKMAIINNFKLIIFPMSIILPKASNSTQKWVSDFNDVVALAKLNNATILSSAGNDGLNLDTLHPDYIALPQMISSIITIGALGTDWRIASYSNFGKCIDYFFPGGETTSEIITTIGTDAKNIDFQFIENVPRGFIKMIGTSLATGLFAGYALTVGIGSLQRFKSANFY